MALNLKLQTKVLKAEATVAGFTVYEGGELMENNRQVGTFAILNDTITGATDVQGLDTAMVRITLFFFTQHQGPHGHGGGGGGHGGGHARGNAPENMTLEGANEFEGQPNQPQPRATARACGSVSAASPALASHITKQFVRTGDNLVIG